MSNTISIRLNGDTQQIAPGTTITQLLQLAGHGERRVAIERNGEIVPRSLHSSTELTGDDQIEIVQAIGGG